MRHGAASPIRRIVLVGFMASGKSTVGRLLAERLGWDFVDFDEVIAEREGRPPGRLIREVGEPAFRAAEAELTAEQAGRGDVVLAPGGGWATQPELALSLGPGTVRVWLRVSPEEAVRRAESDGTDRPLLGGPEGRVERMRRLLERRMDRYAAAELSLDVDDLGPGAVVDSIVRRLGLTTGGE